MPAILDGDWKWDLEHQKFSRHHDYLDVLASPGTLNCASFLDKTHSKRGLRLELITLVDFEPSPNLPYTQLIHASTILWPQPRPSPHNDQTVLYSTNLEPADSLHPHPHYISLAPPRHVSPARSRSSTSTPPSTRSELTTHRLSLRWNPHLRVRPSTSPPIPPFDLHRFRAAYRWIAIPTTTSICPTMATWPCTNMTRATLPPEGQVKVPRTFQTYRTRPIPQPRTHRLRHPLLPTIQ